MVTATLRRPHKRELEDYPATAGANDLTADGATNNSCVIIAIVNQKGGFMSPFVVLAHIP